MHVKSVNSPEVDHWNKTSSERLVEPAQVAPVILCGEGFIGATGTNFVCGTVYCSVKRSL